MKRVVTVLLVLVAIAAVEGAPENDEATGIEESECYDCHKAGGEGSGPVLQAMFRMFLAEAPDLEPGASTQLTFDIRNWWTSEMRGFSGFIDISEAPSLSFEATKDPVPGGKEGTLPAYEPSAYYQGQERSVRLAADVATGGTDLNFTLAPEAGSDADLILRIWGPGQNPETNTPIEIDDAGDGEPEVFAMTGDPIVGGDYLIEVAQLPDTFATPDGSMFDAVDFTLDWVLSYQFVAGATERNGGTLTWLDGQEQDTPQSTQVSWPINVIEEITTEQRIRVYMESVSYYDHAPQFRAVDEWLYWHDVEYVITPDGEGSYTISRVTIDGNLVAEFIVGEQQSLEVANPEGEGPDLTEEKEVPLDIYSEVIGYIAVFLLVVSMLTGGAFGNWSRRIQQFLIYRRGKKRVAFHNVISYGLILAAIIHMVLFLVEPKYPWSVGFFLGSVSIIGMFLSGFTGAFQRAMVEAMGHEGWRWLHYLSFVLAFGGAFAHVLLDGIHFADFQSALNWTDPVAPALEQIIPIDNSTAPADPPA